MNLHEYTKDEWFDVARQFVPGLTNAEYDAMWDRYLADRARHEKLRSLN